MGKKKKNKDIIKDEIIENDESSNDTNEVEETATDMVEVKEEKVDSKKEVKEKAKQEKLNAKKEAKNAKKQERKEKNAESFNNVKKAFSMYAFIVKIVAAVILIAFAIMILIQQERANFTIFIITAGVALITAIVRTIIALIKKDEAKQIKRVIYVVSLIHAIVSIYLIIAAIVYNNELNAGNRISSFSQFNLKYYSIFLAGLLYSEAVAFFMNTVLYKVDSGKFMFWMHIAFMTLSVVILSIANSNNGSVDTNKIVVTLAVIALVCALFIGGEAIIGFYKYRNGKKAEAADREKDTKDEKTGIEAPTNRQDEPLIDPNIIDRKDDNDSALIQ